MKNREKVKTNYGTLEQLKQIRKKWEHVETRVNTESEMLKTANTWKNVEKNRKKWRQVAAFGNRRNCSDLKLSNE